MQDLNPPAIPFLFKLDAELQRSKFTVWRNISWKDGSEIPLFAFKNCWIPYPISTSMLTHIELGKPALAAIQRAKATELREKARDSS